MAKNAALSYSSVILKFVCAFLFFFIHVVLLYMCFTTERGRERERERRERERYRQTDRQRRKETFITIIQTFDIYSKPRDNKTSNFANHFGQNLAENKLAVVLIRMGKI